MGDLSDYKVILLQELALVNTFVMMILDLPVAESTVPNCPDSRT